MLALSKKAPDPITRDRHLACAPETGPPFVFSRVVVNEKHMSDSGISLDSVSDGSCSQPSGMLILLLCLFRDG